MKKIKLKGFSIVKLLVFLAACALIYFVIWPFARDWYIGAQYDKMNKGAKMVYEAAEEFCSGKKADDVESLYCYQFGKWSGTADTLNQKINNCINSDYSDYYYTVIIEGGKVKEAYVAKTEDSKIVGSYPDESTLESHAYEKLSDTNP